MLTHFARDFPFGSFVLALCALALPFLAAVRTEAGVPEPAWLRWYRRSLVAAGIAFAITAATRYLIAARPEVDGLDFYFYLCFGRDSLHGVEEPTLARYAYFPGGYRFWEFVMALAGEGLSTMQLVFVFVLVANAALCGAIVSRCVNSRNAGVLAGLLYLALTSRFEGLDGTTEPICTLFALLGLLAWGGEPLRGLAGWRRALLLGTGLGLAVWVKQQAGLVTFGAAVIVVNFAIGRAENRDHIWQILAVPASAACVLFLALLLEGHGLAPMIIGLWHVMEYEPLGSFVKNLPRLGRQAGPAVGLFLLALFLWAAVLASSFSRAVRQTPWATIVGFSLLAAIATFIQFSKRSSPHYGLLAAPYLAIAVTVMAVRVAQSAGTVWPRLRPIIALATAGFLTLPAVGSMGKQGYFQAWPLVWNPVVLPEPLWHADVDVASDLESLATLVSPGEDVLVLPPRRNVVHFLLGSVSHTNPNGYGWGGPWEALEAMRSSSPDAVIVIHPRSLQVGDSALCGTIACDRAISALPESGYRISSILTSMTLWRREASGAARNAESTGRAPTSPEDGPRRPRWPERVRLPPAAPR